MGCLKLHIESTLPTLKVVYNGLKTYEKGCESVYRYGFNGMEKDDEVKGDGNSYTTEFRLYDPRLGRFFAIDPLANERSWVSPYNFVQNNPINRVDPTGALDEWIEKDGQMLYDNRVTNQEDATALYGDGATYRANGYTYTTSDGSTVQLGDYGFFTLNGQIKSSPDLAEKSLAYTNPNQAMTDAQNQISSVRGNYAYSAGIAGFISTDIAIPEPSDAAVPKWVVYAVLGGASAYYVAKMEAEIDAILRRAGGPQGYMYSLNANVTGGYPVMTWGFVNPTSITILNAGDVWKFGETSSLGERYSESYKNSIGAGGVTEIPLVYGNQVQIKVAEKAAIYGYFLMYGHLPPGNKIFR